MEEKASIRLRPALWKALGFGTGIALDLEVEATPNFLLDVCATAWVGAVVVVFFRQRYKSSLFRWSATLALWLVIVLLGMLRYQIDTALSPLPHMLAIGVFS